MRLIIELKQKIFLLSMTFIILIFLYLFYFFLFLLSFFHIFIDYALYIFTNLLLIYRSYSNYFYKLKKPIS